ncbi:glutamate receptor 2.2 [Rhynchospora pubera]|uniref:Glutamate receptor n=1 Tax=Rhynchospora pubera TaxID=906938 RepID=A0AAV8GCB2_9POAL|nr:glutamate receptor 2.2 [Rhynchospora pubera]
MAGVMHLLQTIRAKAIIGPQKSSQADNVAGLGIISRVPVISFTSTSPTVSSMRLPYFVRTAINDVAQVKTITSLIKAYGWLEVVLIIEETEFGRGIIPDLTHGLQMIHVRVPHRSVINISSTNDQIQQELYKLKTMPTRVFIVHMSSPMGSILFLNAKEVGMMSEGYVWIMTSGVADMVDSLDPRVITAMKGALGVRLHVPLTKELGDFTTRWKKRFHEDNDNPKELVSSEPSIYALWAYDTIYALAMAVENLGVEITQSAYDPTPHLPVLSTGPQLLRALLNIKFQGKAGIREIGYWTEDQGLSRELEYVRNSKIRSTSQQKLNPIVWPGESTTVPKGWEIPVSGSKLRVGVIKGSFAEFMNVEVDPKTNAVIPSGYAVDVFQEAISRLPFGLRYEYQLFGDISVADSLTYDDFVFQAHLEKYDVAIGDITIRYNRSLYVDFSVPYTESGVAMIVPVKQAANKNRFIIFKPLKLSLLVLSVVSVISAAAVICLLEPNLRNNLGSSTFDHIVTGLQLSMLAYQEKLESTLSKIISVAMFFLLLVLKSCYTANLSSMLTVQQLQPTVTDLHDIVRIGDHVGYGKGSFVEGLLIQQLNFEKHKIKGYNIEDWHNALDNRSVAAIVDEVPYIKSFLAKHCNSYTMIPIYKTAGFGFAFPKDSPLEPYISREILNITGGDDIIDIEKKWIGDKSCPDNRGSGEPNKLGLDNFMFLIVFVLGVSVICLLYHCVANTNVGSEPGASNEGSNNNDGYKTSANREENDTYVATSLSNANGNREGNDTDVRSLSNANKEGSNIDDGNKIAANIEMTILNENIVKG